MRLNSRDQNGEEDIGFTEKKAGNPISPTIQQMQNQTTTTLNKFSNFGFFAGSPRATHHVGDKGNIMQQDDEIEVSIEEAIEENLNHFENEKVKKGTGFGRMPLTATKSPANFGGK